MVLDDSKKIVQIVVYKPPSNMNVVCLIRKKRKPCTCESTSSSSTSSTSSSKFNLTSNRNYDTEGEINKVLVWTRRFYVRRFFQKQSVRHRHHFVHSDEYLFAFATILIHTH